jgi:EAL domain-containing protein (putative c-di-GMP-specific phosphodiesterase class I)|tara:strand:- start:121 stop:1338 length:1218 start_codon:yes stop_codon:yes gene_type:complete
MKDNINYLQILNYYNFTSSDANNLKSIYDIAFMYKEDFIKEFYEFLFNFKYTKKFIKNDEIFLRHKVEIIKWYTNLFNGNYKDEYFMKLQIISKVHVEIGLPHHYVNIAFSFVRNFLNKMIIKENKLEKIDSVNKLIDINLDILTIAYSQQKEMKLIDDIIFIKNAVYNDFIIPYFQPIIDAKTLKIVKYESLMRVTNEKKTDIFSIAKFLNLSKEIKVYDSLSKLMIQKVFNIVKIKDIKVSINLSFLDIQNEDFIKYIMAELNSLKSPSYITFEILESDFIEDFSIVTNFTNSLKKLGCKVALDDFGSGYSNLENILMLKPDYIKIDGSLIKNINISKESEIIVQSVIDIAKKLGAKTVAEFVHNKEVLDKVILLEVDYIQGFYLGEPEPLENILTERNLSSK